MTKVIVAGANGFVAAETIRQALISPEFTSIVALARRPLSLPSGLPAGTDSSKLQSVVVEDYSALSQDVKKHFAGADACIWCLAVKPTQVLDQGIPLYEAKRICCDLPLAGMDAMIQSRGATNSPFRFIYMSGTGVPRSRDQKPPFFPEYSFMRGECENAVLEFGAKHEGVEVCCTKPGIITSPDRTDIKAEDLEQLVRTMPQVSVQECAAAQLAQVIMGFEKEPLENDDLVQIGKQAIIRK